MDQSTTRPSQSAGRQRKIRNGIIIAALIILAVIGAMLFFQKKVREQFASASASEAQSAQVTTGSISATVSGTGTLANDGVTDVTVPGNVELDTVYVEAGDQVSEGDALASVNMASVLSALSETQGQLDDLDEQLEAAREDSVDEKVKSAASGRVKAVFASEGDDVAEVMVEKGALLLLSLDGYMAVDVDAGSYAEGDTVEVTASDGTVYSGAVSEIAGGVATILLTDDGPAYGDTVTVGDSATGTLYVHEPLKVTGYTGTVSEVNVEENDTVTSSTTLATLTDTADSANYNAILSERAELEETLQTLVTLYKEGAVQAPMDGRIESVAYGEETEADTAAENVDDGSGETLVLSIDPNQKMTVSIGVDETDVLSLEVGQEAVVSLDSIENETYTGTVTDIDTTASSADGVTQYTATVTLDKTEAMLEGMTASASITIEGVENALLLPEDAVRKTSATAYVYTTYDEESGELGGMVEVTVGLSNGSYVEITEGLSEGDTVYYMENEDTAGMGDGRSPFGGGFDFGGGSRPDAGNMPGGNMPGGNMPGGGNAPSGDAMPAQNSRN